LAELQRLCHMAKAPPNGGEWRAWYARLCRLIAQYHDRTDDAGRFSRRLLREMDSLWGFLGQHGVERKRSQGHQRSKARQRRRVIRPGQRRSAGVSPHGSPAQRITSSAWKRSVGGSVRPSALAVFRLMTSSYFVGISTGKSAGLAPFRMRST